MISLIIEMREHNLIFKRKEFNLNSSGKIIAKKFPI